jgi:hypothetical protein
MALRTGFWAAVAAVACPGAWRRGGAMERSIEKGS